MRSTEPTTAADPPVVPLDVTIIPRTTHVTINPGDVTIVPRTTYLEIKPGDVTVVPRTTRVKPGPPPPTTNQDAPDTLAAVVADLDRIRLIDVRKLASKLDSCVETVLRAHNAGYLPAPVRLGKTGNFRWIAGEIDAWIMAGCPGRAEWERMRAKAWAEAAR
jgi:predicted DNA-binding transcriptional regulator AlpA